MLTEMTDMFGNVLKAGDIVVYNYKYSKYSSEFVRATILGFTNKKVYIEFLDDVYKKGYVFKTLVTQGKIIKAPIPEPSLTDKVKNAIQTSINTIGIKCPTLP